ncbi:MAG: enoyl-CoA hydratase/isomerase family protein, partial [Deltaproteobacteria bacterium]|nr:enoyl-CoA hydratase/isomerase family protein [Deltaproteobacteria bacterium]
MPDQPESRQPVSGQPASDWIIVERRGAIATLVLNNPAKRNALNLELLADLYSTLEALDKEDVCCLIVRGAGDRSFCSGFDISAIPTRIPPAEFAEKAPRNLVQTVIG